jgi:antitoxin (DNA-binding transcriptional repressor) of toxin-antitoxin stability system
MKFVTVRELRGASSRIWERLDSEGELVITNNGKPVAILSPVSDGNLEGSLRSIRRARAEASVQTMQLTSAKTGNDKISAAEIDAEIAASRQERRR